MADHLFYLEECVKAAESCVSTEDAAIRKLSHGIRDYPRLTHVLQNQHHFLLLPADVLHKYKLEISDSLAPQIEELVSRAEEAVERAEKRRGDLGETLKLVQQASLPIHTEADDSDKAAKSTDKPVRISNRGPGSKGSKCPFPMKDNLERRKQSQLRLKRTRLETELAKLG